MALVAYSDSEGSDNESPPSPAQISSKASTKGTDKPAFQKLTNASEPRKIKVDLPNSKPESGNQEDDQPPAKKARIGGGFTGFNSFLPAPKRAAQSAPKAGVSLKTSSEAAFSRAPPTEISIFEEPDHLNGNVDATPDVVAKEEPKLVGKATKFKPLSVGNKKKPIKKAKPVDESRSVQNGVQQPETGQASKGTPTEPVDPPPKPKRSLFSVPQAEETNVQTITASYEPLTIDNGTETTASYQTQHSGTAEAQPTNPHSLQSVASDLNLTPAQQRQLFGRRGQKQDINVTHFNLDNEYAANEQLRQSGEAVEHRAVKAIAPGKHSLQQLVNNARTQQDGLEDKWAAGKQARGEGGSKYGWGK